VYQYTMDSKLVDFSIHTSSGVPIYRQIMDQVLAMIAGGRLAAGDSLPSVRVMAQSLEVNPMTVSKAYTRLEQAGALERLRGRGMVVAAAEAEGSLSDLETRRLEVVPLIEQVVVRARQLNLTDRQILAVVNTYLKENPRG